MLSLGLSGLLHVFIFKPQLLVVHNIVDDSHPYLAEMLGLKDFKEWMSTNVEPVAAHDEKSKFFIFLPEIANGKPRNVVSFLLEKVF